MVPVQKTCPVLITNGIEDVARFHLSSNFVINAEEDGEIVDYDKKCNILIARYKSGKCRAIELNSKLVYNSGGGFYLPNKFATTLKVGDKFKKDDVLAYHDKFFTNDDYNECRLNMGTLAKVAIMSTYNTYEDGTFITKKLSRDASTEMCFAKKVVIGKNANVDKIVNIGDKIEIGDTLISFDTSFEDESINALLANMSEKDKTNILAASKNNIQSKVSGVIEEIKIYATVDLDEMSPTLKQIVSAYYNKINEKKRFLNKYDPDNANSTVKCGVMVTDTSKKIEPNMYGVIKGENVDDGVLFEFYIRHEEPLEVGSKIANFTKMCGEVKPL